MILPEGDMVECSATLAKITRSGGAANQPTAISVEIHDHYDFDTAIV